MEQNIDFAAGGYLPASFLDWEGHVSAVIFCLGCNFRCPWCHNGGLALGDGEKLDLGKILADVERRAAFLDGVVISGGEPTLQPGLPDLARAITELGLPVKLDTNGSRPEVIDALLNEGLVEHIAMDVKAPLGAAAYRRLTGVAADVEKIRASMEIIKSRATSYEFRTTYVPALHSCEDLLALREALRGEPWRVQCFKPNNCLDEKFLAAETAKAEELRRLLPDVVVRG
ncbi:anaerobic ribonucleoside-triphosphate reductase activating protein [uncultured Cloacibacillus sp.]|uniref:anaerobic ribonucleoside-triphosphate reductase activating protein n=1 Tax=uncultured Cloacibacillus sp. TaxID=889794 RepID=UPI002620DFF4|nr:anaerobic ribonucleoside-triphosphate reductase activating protein [uncultured Cloacibacillus sp.]